MNIRNYIVTTISAFVLAITASASALAAADKIGVVGNINGSVTATDATGATRTLKASDPIYLNDVIVSDAGSKAQIMFLDKSALMVNPNTKVTVDRFVFDPATANGDLSINSTKGALRFIGGALSKKKPVKIKTPVSTIGIRGGIADTHIAAGGVTDAIFVYGEEMTMANGQGQVQSITTPGQGLTVVNATSMPAPLPPERVMQHLESFSDAGNAPVPTAEEGNAPEAIDNQAPPPEDNSGGEPQQANNEMGQPKEERENGKPHAENGQPHQGPHDPKGQPEHAGPQPTDGNNHNQGNPRPGPNNGPRMAGDRTGPHGPGPHGPQDGDRGPRFMGNGDRPGPYGSGPGPHHGPAGDNAPHHMADGAPPMGNMPHHQGPGPMGGPTNIANANIPTHFPIVDATQGGQRNDSVIVFNERPFIPTDTGSYILSEKGSATPISAGRSEFERGSSNFHGRLVQDYPNATGPRFAGSLPWLQTSGYEHIGQATFDGQQLSGNTYRTADQAVHYFNLQEVSGNRNLAVVLGRAATGDTWSASATASAANAGNTVGALSFYDFLPDLNGFDNIGTGYFDYNLADNRLGNGANLENNLGMVVNWNKGRFISGRINWTGADANPIERGMVLAFGKTLSNGHVLDGRLFEFHSNQTAMGVAPGFLRSNLAYSAQDGGAFSGMLLEGVLPLNEALTVSDVFAVGVDGPRIFQPIVQGNATSSVTTSIDNSTGGERKGFAGGFMQTTIQGSGTLYKRMANSDVSDVVITPDTVNGDVAASLKLNNVDDAGRYVEVKFGDVSGTNFTGDNAYLTDNLYAAQQSKYEYYDGTNINTYTGEAVANGALVSASLIAGTTNNCTACQFVDWGVWAGEADRSVMGGNQIIDIAAMVPYVSGQVTENLAANVSVQNLGQVDYQGAMYGSTLTNGVLARADGSFTAGIDLNNRKLTDFNANIAGMNFGFANQAHTIQGSGLATFDNIAVQNLASGSSASSINGHINGALFGANAEDLGGNFAVQNTINNTQAAGVYLGTRQ